MLAASEKRNKGESGSSGVVSTKLDEYGRVREGAGSELSSIPEKLWDTMPEYQKDGVRFVLERDGRAMIADEPGLGKTIQAIASASAYRHSEWPLLIICPSSARYHWEVELNTWLSDKNDLQPHEIVVLTSASHVPPGHTRVVIVSYDLVYRILETTLQRIKFKIIIADECHYLKNGKAKRTKAILPLLKTARRAILLSGTPALSRPSELFWQLHALDAEAWKDFTHFTNRYCKGGAGGGGGGGGAAKGDDDVGDNYVKVSNVKELYTVLHATLMIRREKKKILKTLPEKKRRILWVNVENAAKREELRCDLAEFRSRQSDLAELYANAKSRRKQRAGARPPTPPQLAPAASAAAGAAPGFGMIDIDGAIATRDAPASREELIAEKKSLLMKLFRESGAAKLEALKRHVNDLIAHYPGKFIVFAHHRAVLDAIAGDTLAHVSTIRIDGTTMPRERQLRVKRFQTDPSVRVALLGITAAGIALTLTAASRVLFAEIFWTPAALLQAEDRVHRIGQQDEVQIEYLLAHDTVDDILWPLIQKKMAMLGELIENKANVSMAADGDDAGDAAGGAAAAADDEADAAAVDGELSLGLNEMVDELVMEGDEDTALLDEPKPDDDDDDDAGGGASRSPSPVPTMLSAPPAGGASAAAQKPSAAQQRQQYAHQLQQRQLMQQQQLMEQQMHAQQHMSQQHYAQQQQQQQHMYAQRMGQTMYSDLGGASSMGPGGAAAGPVRVLEEDDEDDGIEGIGVHPAPLVPPAVPPPPMPTGAPISFAPPPPPPPPPSYERNLSAMLPFGDAIDDSAMDGLPDDMPAPVDMPGGIDAPPSFLGGDDGAGASAAADGVGFGVDGTEQALALPPTAAAAVPLPLAPAAAAPTLPPATIPEPEPEAEAPAAPLLIM